MKKITLSIMLLVSVCVLNAQTERNEYYFETDTDIESWESGSSTVTATGGNLVLTFDKDHNQPGATSNGTDYYINATANKYMHITLKNNSALATQLRVKFEDAGAAKPIAGATDLSDDTAGFVTYHFDMGNKPTWTGNIGKVILLFRNKDNTSLKLTGNIQISSIIFDNNPTLAINHKIEESIFNLYPNPIKDNLKLSSKNPISHVEIFNTLGQLKLTKNTNNQRKSNINTSRLAKGVYILKVKTNNVFESYKIVKN